MILMFAWTLSIPILYIMYYSDFRNRFAERNEISQIKPLRVKAFLLAVTGPVGLGAYVMACLILMMVYAWDSGYFENPFLVFPLYFPGRE